MIEAQSDVAPFRQTWDTSNVARKERFSYFREGVCQTAFAITPEQIDDRIINARMERADLPRGFISKVDMSPHRAFRTETDLAKIPGEFFALMLQVTGGSRQIRNGKIYYERPAEVNLVNCNEVVDFQASSNSRYAGTIVAFNKSFLASEVNSNRRPKFGPFSAIALRSCLQLITDRYDTASQQELTCLFEASIALASADCISDREYLEHRGTRESVVALGIFHAIRAYAIENIADAGLSSYSIAHHFRISSRYVQKLFASQGTTLKSFVTNSRLDQIRLELLDRSIAHVALSDIAFRWGFRDMTTFHRNFRNRFGDTPSQLRVLLKDAPTPRQDAEEGLPEDR